MTPKTLSEAIRYYSDEQVCIDAVAAIRWADGKPECPKCGVVEAERKHYWLKTQRRWKCYSCRKHFSVKVGSIFEDSPLGLDIWMIALWMLVNCKNGVSSYEIARATGIAQKSAWFVLQRLRFILAARPEAKLSGGPIEVDESFHGGEPKNKHLSQRQNDKWITGEFGDTWKNPDYKSKAGRGSDKVAVFGMLDRSTREVRAKVIPAVRRDVLMDAIISNVEKGSKVYCDGLTAYNSLKAQTFVHETVNHLNEYVRGDVHTNGIENFWALLKRTLKGTYVAVEPFHLDLYVDEQVFRFNNRIGQTDGTRFQKALGQASGKRLTWMELTGKTVSKGF